MTATAKKAKPKLTPPNNLDAERAVIGSCFLLPEVLDDVSMLLKPDDFYDARYAMIYDAMLGLHAAGKKFDIAIVAQAMRKVGTLDDVGGAATLAEIVQSVPTAAHARHYAEMVREASLLRSVETAGVSLCDSARDPSADASAVVAKAESMLFAIAERAVSVEAQTDVRVVLSNAMARISERLAGETEDTRFVKTDFRDLDEKIIGLPESELIIVAARPSMGKSALASQLAINAAASKKPALFVALEMTAIDLADRMLCAAAGVDMHRMRTNTLTQDDRKAIIEANAWLSELPLQIDDAPRRTVTEIASLARRMKRKQGLGLLVIDYLQLIEPENPKDSREQQVARMARRLKHLARELKVPVVCLAQLNREAEKSANNRPKLSHLRESGAIEQDADAVMFVHREEYYRGHDTPPSERGVAEIIIAKQRNGPTGVVKLAWFKESVCFADLAHHVESAWDECEFR